MKIQTCNKTLARALGWDCPETEGAIGPPIPLHWYLALQAVLNGPTSALTHHPFHCHYFFISFCLSYCALNFLFRNPLVRPAKYINSDFWICI